MDEAIWKSSAEMVRLNCVHLTSSLKYGNLTSESEGDGVEYQVRLTPRQISEVVLYCEGASNDGDLDAMHALGILYRYGQGLEEDQEKYMEMQMRAADGGHVASMMALAEVYETPGKNFDPVKSLELYERAREAGSRDAATKLTALLEMDGAVNEKDIEHARRIHENLADEGDVFAQYHLGRVESSNLEALRKVGNLFLHGCGGALKSIEQAKKLLLRAADGGNVQAKKDLAESYRCGTLTFDESNGLEMDVSEVEKFQESEALKWFQRAARDGDSIARRKVADIYRFGHEDIRDVDKAIVILEELAAERDSGAMLALATVFDSMTERDDLEKALYWLRLAVHHGSPEAIIELAVRNHECVEETRDYAEARRLYELAIQMGGQEKGTACLRLGCMFLRGDGIDQDIGKAEHLFITAAENGYCSGLCDLARFYADGGRGIEQNRTKAYDLLTRVIRGEFCSVATPNAFHQLGMMLEDDNEFAASLEMYERGALNDCPESKSAMAHLFNEGLGVDQNASKAVQLYTEAAEGKSARAMFALALMYQNGLGVSIDQAKAAGLLWEASMYGHVDAPWELSLMYEYGIGVNQSMDEALDLLELASDGGSRDAMLYLGRLYKAGRGVEQNVGKALDLFELVLESGTPEAAHEMAEIYFFGLGDVEPNTTKAIELYQRAVDCGDSEGLYNLARVYSDGTHVSRDASKAMELLERAILQNNGSAILFLATMYNYGHRGGDALGCVQGSHLVSQDESKAVELYQRALQKSEKWAVAAFALGKMYAQGRGVELDVGKAEDLFSLAAWGGVFIAKFHLAELYENGMGARTDFEDNQFAANAHEHAKNLNEEIIYECAQRNIDEPPFLVLYTLARMYEDGRDIDQNLRYEARDYFNLAVDCSVLSSPDFSFWITQLNMSRIEDQIIDLTNNYSEAQALVHLAIMSRDGHIIDKDTKVAEYLHRLAVAKGGIQHFQEYFLRSFGEGRVLHSDIHYGKRGEACSLLRAVFDHFQSDNFSWLTEPQNVIYCIGKYYENGPHARSNLSKYLHLFQLAVEGGNTEAELSFQRSVVELASRLV